MWIKTGELEIANLERVRNVTLTDRGQTPVVVLSGDGENNVVRFKTREEAVNFFKLVADLVL
jgi:hypothetical protein